jgi:hypothetical protein
MSLQTTVPSVKLLMAPFPMEQVVQTLICWSVDSMILTEREGDSIKL